MNTVNFQALAAFHQVGGVTKEGKSNWNDSGVVNDASGNPITFIVDEDTCLVIEGTYGPSLLIFDANGQSHYIRLGNRTSTDASKYVVHKLIAKTADASKNRKVGDEIYRAVAA